MPPLVEICQETLVLPSFTLECGETLRDVPVAYKTWGKLNEQRDNVMVICHAFTGSSDVEDWCVLLHPYLSSCSHSSSACAASETAGFLLMDFDLQVGSIDGTRQSVRLKSILHHLRKRRWLTIWDHLARINRSRYRRALRTLFPSNLHPR